MVTGGRLGGYRSVDDSGPGPYEVRQVREVAVRMDVGELEDEDRAPGPVRAGATPYPGRPARVAANLTA